MKKHTFLAVLLILALLCGCTPAAPAESDPPATVPTETTLPTEPLVIIPDDPVELEAANHLSARKFIASPDVAVLDRRTAAFLTTEYIPADGITVTHLLVLDLYTDTVIAEKTLNQAFSLPLQSHLPGVLPLFDPITNDCVIFDRHLREVSRFSCDDRKGVFAPDLSAYYCLSAMRICRVDPATGEAELVETDLTLPVDAIVDYDPEKNILLLEVHTQYYLTELCTGAVDLDTGELLLLSDVGDQANLTSDGLLLEQMAKNTTSDVLSLCWDGSVTRALDVMPKSMSTTSRRIPLSDYLYSIHYGAGDVADSVKLYRFAAGYESCELSKLIKGMDPSKMVSLPDGNLLSVDYSRRGTKICLICTDQLTFTPVQSVTTESYALTWVDESIPESYTQRAAYVEVPEALAEVRAIADELEQTYDITIIMSNQCDRIIEDMEMTINTTGEADLANEAKLLESALKDLKKCLKLYPEGFFSQFRNAAGERGILVMLVEDIYGLNSDKNVDTLGVTYDMGDWYPIAVDITTRDLPATYCHEIWHAMENKIKDVNPSLLNDVKWGELNPQGFSYKGAVIGYYNDKEYTFIEADAGKDSYFVDTYGKTKPEEDRARLMEYIMTTDFSAKYMMEAPVLHDKMQMMINAVRGVFDTTGWDDIYWERFH